MPARGNARAALQLTATSRTSFANRKLSFRNLLSVVALFANGDLSAPACCMSRDRECSRLRIDRPET